MRRSFGQSLRYRERWRSCAWNERFHDFAIRRSNQDGNRVYDPCSRRHGQQIRGFMNTLKTLVWFGLLAFPAMLYADSFNVSLNTAPVSGSTFTLLFQFTDGSGTSDGNNTILVDNLTFGTAGSAAGVATLNGGASGDVTNGFAMTDADFSNTVEQQFVAGSTLAFTVQLSENPEQPAPDEFAFSIEQIGTADVGGAFVVIDVGSSPVTFAASGNGNAADNIGNPTVTSPVPEPSTIVLLGFGISVAFARCRCLARRAWRMTRGARSYSQGRG